MVGSSLNYELSYNKQVLQQGGESMQTIHVLIVDDHPDMRENIRKMLQFDENIIVVGEGSNGIEAIDLAQKYKPEIILLDLNMPKMNGIDSLEVLGEKCPNTDVIVISVQGESDYLKKAMLLGAKEYLVKPFSPDQLITAIYEVYETSKKRKAKIYAHQVLEEGLVTKPKIITIYAGKGGVGKSSLAINTAVALAKKHKKVVIVDLDLFFGDVAIYLNLPVRYSIYHLAQEYENLRSADIFNYLLTHQSGVMVLAAPVQPEQGEIVSGKVIEKVLRLLKEHFDYIIIDTAPSLVDVSITALEHADYIWLVNTLNVPVLKHNRIAFELFQNLNFSLEKIRIIVNRSNVTAGIYVKDVNETFQLEPYILLEKDNYLDTAINRGEPLYLLKPNNKYSKKIAKLINRLIAEDDRTKGYGKNALKRLFPFFRRR